MEQNKDNYLIYFIHHFIHHIISLDIALKVYLLLSIDNEFAIDTIESLCIYLFMGKMLKVSSQFR